MGNTNTNTGKAPEKTVDLPPYGPRNPDPITDSPGSHPIETGVGAALGGAATGASIGMVLGPPGVVLGTIAGAVAGGLAGKGVGELLDPTTEDNWIREWLAERRERDQLDDASAEEAYRFGVKAELMHPNRTFDQAELDLKADWERTHPPGPRWEAVIGSARAGFERMQQTVRRPGG